MVRQEDREEGKQLIAAVEEFWKEEGRLTREGLRIRQEIITLSNDYVYYCIHKITKTPAVIIGRMAETYHSVFDNLMNLKNPKGLKLWAGRLALQHIYTYAIENVESYPLKEDVTLLTDRLAGWREGPNQESYLQVQKQAGQIANGDGILIPEELLEQMTFFEKLTDLIRQSSMLRRFIVISFYLNGIRAEQIASQFSLDSELVLLELWEFEQEVQEKLVGQKRVDQGLKLSVIIHQMAAIEQAARTVPQNVIDELLMHFKEEYYSQKNRQQDDDVMRAILAGESVENISMTEDIMDLKEKLRIELEEVQKQAKEENDRRRVQAELERQQKQQVDPEQKKSMERERIRENRREEDLMMREKLEPDRNSRYRMIFVIAAIVCCIVVIIVLANMYDNMSEKLSGQEGPNQVSATSEPKEKTQESAPENELAVTYEKVKLPVSESEAYAMNVFVNQVICKADGTRYDLQNVLTKGKREEALRRALDLYRHFLSGELEDVKQQIYQPEVNSFLSYYKGREKVYGIISGYQITQAFLLSDFNRFYRSLFGTEADRVSNGELEQLNDEAWRFQYVRADKMILFCVGEETEQDATDAMFYIEDIVKNGSTYHLKLKSVSFAYGITSRSTIQEEESFASDSADSYFQKQELAREYLNGDRTSVFFREGESLGITIQKTKMGYRVR